MQRNNRTAFAANNQTAPVQLKSLSNPTSSELLESRRMLSGTWSTITNLPPSGAQMGVVLTNGAIMVHGGGGSASNAWYKLTPSSTGSYTAGTWSTLASSNVYRLYDATEVLQSGKVLVVGGEYSGSNSASTFNNTGEIYDPAANTWTNITNFPQTHFGDDPTELLPNGQVLTGYISGPQTYIYNPTANTWTATGTKLRNDQSDEEGWVTLPDHSILSYDVFSSVSSGVAHSQRYIPSTGTWVDAGTLPAQLSAASVGYELGPGVLLPDGRVFYAGGTNATAFYTPSTNTWAAGPNMPNGYCMADAASAVLPNGDVLMVMSPQGGLVSGAYNFPSPSYVYEFNPTTNIYTNVSPSLGTFLSSPSYLYTLLVLPTGQVAMMGDRTTIAIYTPSGTTVSTAIPVIAGITYGGSTGVYTLSGTNLNGINEGAAYGDDNEMSSNYPLIRLTSASGVVSYATSTNWSNTGVAQGAETVTFTLPAADTTGAYLIQSVANGIPSATALAVLVNANTTTTVNIQTDSNPANVDVVGSSVTDATFPVSAFSAIYVAGDNSGDTLSVNLTNSAGTIVTNIQAGSGTDTINVNQTSSTGPVVIDPSAGNDAVSVGTAGANTAIAQFLASQQIGLLTVGNGGSATVGSSGTKKLLQVNGVATSGTGFLDLTNNYMIVHNGNLTSLGNEISSGLNLGAGYWNGPGITSSTAAADTTHNTALGMILNSSNAGNTLYGSGAPLGLFAGASPALTDVLIKYTYFGDTNLNGGVDGTDYSAIDNGYLTHATGWFNGDFNYDNVVNGTDYTLIDNTFNTQGANVQAGIAAVIATAKPAAKPQANGATRATAAAWPASTASSDVDLGDSCIASISTGSFATQPAVPLSSSFSSLPIESEWDRIKLHAKSALEALSDLPAIL
jgi:hypothetical protein